MKALATFVLVGLVACSSTPPAATTTTTSPAEPGQPAEPPAQPTSGPVDQSAAGASFTLPEGWTAERQGEHIRITDPEKQLSLWLVDLPGHSGGDAISAAWKIVVPGFEREVDDTVSPPVTDGWDAITQVTYKVPAADSRVVLGVSREKAGVAYVVLLDAPVPVLQRRGAQLGQIIDSHQPAAVDEESFAGKQAAPFDAERQAALRSFAEDARQKLRVPGAAIAVVQGGKVVWTEGLGVKRTGKPHKVTPETAFMIGSTTKSLTSLMMAVQVDEKQFGWTTPMKEVLPSFKLGDPEVTDKIEMQHSMCACTGLPRQDMEFLFQFAKATPESRLAELATFVPTTGFGETFQYSNALVSAGGFAAAKARFGKKPLSAAYRDAMSELVLQPLGMKSTRFDTKGAARGNHARPHGYHVGGDYIELPLSYEDAVVSVAPAGGAWSTVGDLARYLQLELARGMTPDGKRLVSEQALLERRKPRVQIGKDSAYGLALGITDQGGLLSVGHNGNTLGFSALMTFWPDHDLGIVVLTNAQGANHFTGLVQRKLVELVFDGAQQKADKGLAFAVDRRQEVIAKGLDKIDSTDTAWLEPLVGRYSNDSLGTLTIRKKGKTFVADVGEWQSDVAKHIDAGQSTVVLVGPPVATLQLQPQDDGSLLLDVGQQKYVFTREGGKDSRPGR